MDKTIKTEIVIFDWSGTISDDMDVVIDASNRILERLGVKARVTRDYLRKNYTQDYMDFYKALGVNAERAKINRMYVEEFLGSRVKPKIVDDAKGVLEWLDSSGKKLFVISSHPMELLEKESKDYGVSRLIKRFYPDSIKKEDDIEKIVKLCGADKEKVVFVGDTFVDIEAGKAAGVTTVAVLNGYQDEETVRRHKPDFILRGVGGLRRVVN